MIGPHRIGFWAPCKIKGHWKNSKAPDMQTCSASILLESYVPAKKNKLVLLFNT